jgi:hypothetical protein
MEHDIDLNKAGYVAQYKMLISGVHAVWPKAQIILVVGLLNDIL